MNAIFRRLFGDTRGSGDLMSYCLLAAGGIAMISVALPTLFESSNAAARTFKGQVNVLEQGAGGGGVGGAGVNLNIGADGWNVNVNTGAGNIGVKATK